MSIKLLVVDTVFGGNCVHCGNLTLRLDSLAQNAVGQAVFVCDCGGGQPIEEVYPTLKHPENPLEFYLDWIAHYEQLRSDPSAGLRKLRHLGQLIHRNPPASKPGMTPEQFCYWLQGRAELVAQAPTEAEWAAIVAHLSLVFNKVTPSGPGLNPGDYLSDRAPQLIC